MPGADPAHVQSRGDWHRLAVAMRDTRTGTAEEMRARGTKTAKANVDKTSW